MAPKPDAFLSYTRFDDEDGEISAFRERLSRTVRQVSGKPFHIFQDVDDEAGIALGERWKDKLDEMLDQARFFIPILTPKLLRERTLPPGTSHLPRLGTEVGRRDLVLPIYWITVRSWKKAISRRKTNWRRRSVSANTGIGGSFDRFEDLRSAVCRRELHALSTQIERARRNVLRVVETAEPEVVGEAGRARTPRSNSAATTRAKPTPSKPKPEPKKAKATPTLWTPGEVFRDIQEPWCPEMVKIPAGTFLMGSPENEEGRHKNEGPQHEVTISK